MALSAALFMSEFHELIENGEASEFLLTLLELP
jgi:hypothetical protein